MDIGFNPRKKRKKCSTGKTFVCVFSSSKFILAKSSYFTSLLTPIHVTIAAAIYICAALPRYLVSLQVAYPLGDRSLHAAAVVPQLAVLPAEVLFLLQQGDVATRQFRLVDLQHRRPAQRFAQRSPDFLRALLEAVQQLLVD